MVKKKVCKNRRSLPWVMLGHRWPAGEPKKTQKIDNIDRSRKKIEKAKKGTPGDFDYLSNKKKFLKFGWVLNNDWPWTHRHTDTRTDTPTFAHGFSENSRFPFRSFHKVKHHSTGRLFWRFCYGRQFIDWFILTSVEIITPDTHTYFESVWTVD